MLTWEFRCRWGGVVPFSRYGSGDSEKFEKTKMWGVTQVSQSLGLKGGKMRAELLVVRGDGEERREGPQAERK